MLLAAVPRVEMGAGAGHLPGGDGGEAAHGDMPSPLNPPTGCHFHPRCSEAIDRCRTVYPEETRLSATRIVRCHLY
jgi:peptide/nickel transport system ATP-binding protein